MASPGGTASPLKPWERARSSTSGGSIFMPSSGANSTSAVVESAGVADPPEKASATNTAVTAQNGTMVTRPTMPVRSYGTGYPTSNYNHYGNNAYSPNSYGAYNNYNRGYGLGGGMYGGSYGLGNSYGGGYGGGLYGNGYGGGMYGNGLGMGMGMGMGVPGPFNGPGDPNNPHEDGHPAGPPSVWQDILKKMHWVVTVFGHIATLVSENAQTFYILSTALLQLFERSGMLYGELARFVLRILGRTRRKSVLPKSPNLALPGPPGSKNPASTLQIEGPKGPSGSWDNVWGGDGM